MQNSALNEGMLCSQSQLHMSSLHSALSSPVPDRTTSMTYGMTTMDTMSSVLMPPDISSVTANTLLSSGIRIHSTHFQHDRSRSDASAASAVSMTSMSSRSSGASTTSRLLNQAVLGDDSDDYTTSIDNTDLTDLMEEAL